MYVAHAIVKASRTHQQQECAPEEVEADEHLGSRGSDSAVKHVQGIALGQWFDLVRRTISTTFSAKVTSDAMKARKPRVRNLAVSRRKVCAAHTKGAASPKE